MFNGKINSLAKVFWIGHTIDARYVLVTAIAVCLYEYGHVVTHHLSAGVFIASVIIAPNETIRILFLAFDAVPEAVRIFIAEPTAVAATFLFFLFHIIQNKDSCLTLSSAFTISAMCALSRSSPFFFILSIKERMGVDNASTRELY